MCFVLSINIGFALKEHNAITLKGTNAAHQVFLCTRIQSAPETTMKANVTQKSSISIRTASAAISSNILTQE